MTRQDLDPVDVLASQLVRYEPPAQRASVVRAALLQVASEAKPVARSRRQRILVGVAAFAAAACVVPIVRAALRTDSPAEVTYRGHTLASDGAVYWREGPPGHEVVHVSDGVMRFEVTPLAPGESFHVVVGEHRVEVRGTVFHVAARHDHLVSVSVARGHVDVFGPGKPVAHLAVGESWPVDEPPAKLAATLVEESSPALPAHDQDPAPRPRKQPQHATAPLRAAEPIAPDASVAPVEPAPAPGWPGESEFRDGWSAYERADFGHAAEWLGASCRLAASGEIAEDGCFWYAVALDRGGRSADAITAYRAFLQRWPAKRRSDDARIKLAALLAAEGLRDEARPLLQEAARSERSSIRDSARQALRSLDAVAP